MTKKSDLPAIPETLIDLALIDGPTCAAAAGVSVSAFLEAVRKGEAPAAAIRRHRFTRWRLADIRTWLAQLPSQLKDDSSSVIEAAKRASQAAQAKRHVKAKTHTHAVHKTALKVGKTQNVSKAGQTRRWAELRQQAARQSEE